MLRKTITLPLLVGILLFISSCGISQRFSTNESVPNSQDVGQLPSKDNSIVPLDLSELPPAERVIASAKAGGVALDLVEKGVASWYGAKFHGRSTASGEPYDMHSLTAAHRTLPFGTILLVENKTNGKAVRVRINDRGPYSKNRIIDLSKRAAKEIGLIRPGSAPVRLYVTQNSLKESSVKNLKTPTYTIQLGSYEKRSQAYEHSNRVTGSRVQIVHHNNNLLYRVYYGLYLDKTKAYQKERELEREQINGYVTQIENS